MSGTEQADSLANSRSDDAQKLAALRRVLDLPLGWAARRLLLLTLVDHADDQGRGVLHVSELRRRTDLDSHELREELEWLSHNRCLTYDFETGRYLVLGGGDSHE